MATTPGGRGRRLTAAEIAWYAYQAGFRGEALATAVAVALAESGGWTGAHNPNGEDSRGLWQINVAPNVRRNTWGDLFDPAANARAAFAVSGGGKNFNPWTTYAGSTEAGRRSSYRNHLQEAEIAAQAVERNPDAAVAPAGTARAETGEETPAQAAMTEGGEVTVGPDGTLTVTPKEDITADTPPEEIEAYIRKHYPDVAPYLLNAEIKMLLYAAAIEDWDETRLEAALRNSQYFRTHSPAARRLDALQATDRNAAVMAIEGATAIVADQAARLGLDLDPVRLGEAGKNALKQGYISFGDDGSVSVANAGGLNDWLAGGLRFQREEQGAGLPAGDAAASADSVQALARQYLVPITRRQAEDWALKIIEGTATEDTVTNWLSGLAKARYAGNQDVLSALERGFTTADYFSGHVATVANLLEVDDTQIDLTDPKWSWITETVDPKGQRRVPTLGEVAQAARSRPEFANTALYRQQSAEMTSNLVRFFYGAA